MAQRKSCAAEKTKRGRVKGTKRLKDEETKGQREEESKSRRVEETEGQGDGGRRTKGERTVFLKH